MISSRGAMAGGEAEKEGQKKRKKGEKRETQAVPARKDRNRF